MGYRRVANLTNALVNQNLDDIFREFYRLETILNNKKWYAQSYVTIRLVTVIEQFFREIIVIQLQKGKMKPPDEIMLRSDNLSNATSVSPEVIISASYSCQSVYMMKTILRDSGLKDVLQRLEKYNIDLEDFTDLFKSRHDVVHTVSLLTPDQARYHKMIEDLMRFILCEVYDEDSHFYFSKGNAFAQLKKPLDALRYYDKVSSSKVDSFNLCYNKGITLAKLNRYGEAIALYEEATQLKPDDARVYNSRGISLDAINRHEEAMECFEYAIKINPRYALAYNNKGALLANSNKHKEAIAFFEEAIRLKPDYTVALNNKRISLNALIKHEKTMGHHEGT